MITSRNVNDTFTDDAGNHGLVHIMARTTKTRSRTNFPVMSRKDVPQGRNGKHHQIVKQILSDLDHIGASGGALKVPLSQLDGGKERVRSALNRATRKRGLTVATASDDTYLYVWSEPA
jgi:hypothetical protein